MKKFSILFVLMCLVWASHTYAQTFISMRPNWTFNTPIAENNTYEYYVSKGVGDTEKEARKDALTNAFKEAQSRIGVGANSAEIFNSVQTSDKEFNVIADDYKIPMKEVCVFSEKSRDGKYYYYQLLQIAIRGNVIPNFKQYKGDCYDFSKAKELREILKEEYKDRIAADEKARQEAEKEAKQKQKDSIRAQKRIRLLTNPYCDKGKNRYVAWKIAGTGYPWNLVSGVEFRYGNIVGVGAYLDLGMDFTHVQVSKPVEEYSDMHPEVATTTKTAFRYAGGLKFFPFKGLFIDCGYGTIVKPQAEVTYDYHYGNGGRIDDKDDRVNITKQITNSHGLLFHVGYDFVTDLSKPKPEHTGFFGGINIGASYDIRNNSFAPSANIKIGIAWRYK